MYVHCIYESYISEKCQKPNHWFNIDDPTLDPGSSVSSRKVAQRLAACWAWFLQSQWRLRRGSETCLVLRLLLLKNMKRMI